jgi:hypothetical protein
LNQTSQISFLRPENIDLFDGRATAAGGPNAAIRVRPITPSHTQKNCHKKSGRRQHSRFVVKIHQKLGDSGDIAV